MSEVSLKELLKQEQALLHKNHEFTVLNANQYIQAMIEIDSLHNQAIKRINHRNAGGSKIPYIKNDIREIKDPLTTWHVKAAKGILSQQIPIDNYQYSSTFVMLALIAFVVIYTGFFAH